MAATVPVGSLRNNAALDGDWPIFGWSDTWQLAINTVTNIVSMLMVFLIQNTQNRESAALQLEVDELLRAVGAHKTHSSIWRNSANRSWSGSKSGMQHS